MRIRGRNSLCQPSVLIMRGKFVLVIFNVNIVKLGGLIEILWQRHLSGRANFKDNIKRRRPGGGLGSVWEMLITLQILCSLQWFNGRIFLEIRTFHRVNGIWFVLYLMTIPNHSVRNALVQKGLFSYIFSCTRPHFSGFTSTVEWEFVSFVS